MNRCPHCGATREIPAAVLERERRLDESLRIRWFKYYTYIGLPLAGLALLWGIVFDRSVLLAVDLLDLGVLATLFWGLHKRRLWGWYLNWYYLLVGCVSARLYFGYESTEDVVVDAVATLLWFVANGVYFRRRRPLFTTAVEKTRLVPSS